MGRKIQFQTEAAFGSAHLMLKGDSYRGFIHQLKGRLLYTKSMFNLIHLQYLSRRTIPEIDIWMTEALYQAYGRFQYLIPPSDFLLTRKIEIGKSYHNVYTGLQYRFNSHYQLVNNDIVHRIGFQSYLMTDTHAIQWPQPQFSNAWGRLYFFACLQGEAFLPIINLHQVDICKRSWGKQCPFG